MTKRKKVQFAILSAAVIVILLTAALGRFFAPNDPYLVNLENALAPPSGDYPFGCDDLGRCILSRILYGASTSIFASLLIVLFVCAFGTIFGVTAALEGGITEKILMKINVVFQAFPDFILAIAIAGMLSSGFVGGIISLCVVCWTKYARLARSLTLEIRDSDYLRSAVISGAGKPQLIFRHIMPNVFSQMVIMAALDISGIILSFASLSFLGLSVRAPAPEWGLMISESRKYLQSAPWTVLAPGAALFAVVVVMNLFADTLRDISDAKRRTSLMQ